MKRSNFVMLCALLLFSAASFAQDFSTYESRRQWVIDTQKDVSLVNWGKHGIPRALAKLYNDPHDREAITYLSNILDHRNQTMFDFPGMALALCRYWDSFTPEQRLKIQTTVEGLAKVDHNGGEGFMGHGTENHAALMWTGAYLFAQQFPDARWKNGMNSEELKREMKERLRKTFKNYYHHGQSEHLSTTYEITINFPVSILLECAEDREMRDIAEAFLLYKWALLSLNSFQGTTLAPFARMNTQQNHRPEDGYVANGGFYNWLMWGWGEATNNFRRTFFDVDYEINEGTYLFYPAVSRIVPDDVFFRLATMEEDFTLKSSAGFFGHYGQGVPHMIMRKIYRNKHYAIGTGNFRWIPGGDGADHDANAFSIVWPSDDRFNYIGCYHPFWYSDGDDRTADTWNRGNVSPFQQSVLHKNTAIILFDIPDKDPWPGKPPHGKWEWRDGHADNLIKRGMLRYPKSIDEKVEENGWIFLREKDTYIGIKPLKDYYIQTDLKEKYIREFNVVKSDHARTGFVFELGSKEESGSFEQFRARLQKNKLSVQWNPFAVNYTNSKKDRIRIQYAPGLPVKEIPENERADYWPQIGCTGLAESVPEAAVNGKKETSCDEWPMIESPYVHMDHYVLKIDDGKTKITVDWTGELPVISRNAAE